MSDKEEILATLKEIVTEDEYEHAELSHDKEGWKLMLRGFMEPWTLGHSVEEAKSTLKQRAGEGFGPG
jgi:hypothetical protein